MNYRHFYHAGNFADVFRHVLLVGLIQNLLIKDKPICYLDTHAGIGSYDLLTEAAQKTEEYRYGIEKIWNSIKPFLSDFPDPDTQSATSINLIHDYVQLIRKFNLDFNAENLHYYPGSPCIVRSLLRAQDRMILTELHTEDVQQLKKIFYKDKQVAVHHLDGYQAVKAFLPPKENRGLVFIDPPFEKKDEFNQLVLAMKLAVSRWPNGIYAIWYPIKQVEKVNDFYRSLKLSGIRKIVSCELTMAFTEEAFHACGMVVINPPWKWQTQIEKIMPALCHLLNQPLMGTWQMNWLVPE